jgi:predicted RNase H-like HicB family nuclease
MIDEAWATLKYCRSDLEIFNVPERGTVLPEYPKHKFEVRPLPEEDGGGFLVTFPDLSGCMADGASMEEALAEAVDAEDSWLKTRADILEDE